MPKGGNFLCFSFDPTWADVDYTHYVFVGQVAARYGVSALTDYNAFMVNYNVV
jgi:hypothetical protein